MGQQAGSYLSKRFGTQVCVERVYLGFLNRLVIDGLFMNDQKGVPMLQASRLSVKFDVFSLMSGGINISSAQLFGIKANLYQANKHEQTNFQFLIDSLASKDTTSQSKPINLNSMIIRRGSLRYRVLDQPKENHFSFNDMALTEISSHIVFNHISNDSLNVKLKNLSFKEKSGLHVKSLTAKLIANSSSCFLENFNLSLPHSMLHVDEVRTNYHQKNHHIDLSTLSYKGRIKSSKLTLADFSFLDAQLSKYTFPFDIKTSFHGNRSSLTLSNLQLQAENMFKATANATLQDLDKNLKWMLELKELGATSKMLSTFFPKIAQQSPFQHFTNLKLKGLARGVQQDFNIDGQLASNLGELKFRLHKEKNNYNGTLETIELSLDKLLKRKDLGNITSRLELKDFQRYSNHSKFLLKGDISKIDYKGYTYHHIYIDGNGLLNPKNEITSFEGVANLNDPNGELHIRGKVNRHQTIYQVQLDAQAKDLHLAALNISKKLPHRKVSFEVGANVSGKSLKDATGQLSLNHLRIVDQRSQYQLNHLDLKAGFDEKHEHFVSINGDFGSAMIVGTFDYDALSQNVVNIMIEKLPSLQHLTPIRQRHTAPTNARLYADIRNTDWAPYFFGVPFVLHQPLQISGTMESSQNLMNVHITAPDFTYEGKKYYQCYAHLQTRQDTLCLDAELNRLNKQDKKWSWSIKSAAANNHLLTKLSFDNHESHPFRGTVNTETQFFKNNKGDAAAHINIHPSEILVEDSIWRIEPSDIIYSKNHLNVDYFSIHHDDQHIIVSGLATRTPNDSLLIDLKDIDVSYVLNLLNFHAVEFGGLLSGKVVASGLFGNPRGHADVLVNQFKFETGRMGALDAHVAWNEKAKQIDINAVANDEHRKTVISGYVSPERDYLDLDILANNTRLEFLEGFCDSFMQQVDANGRGRLRLFGNLGSLNLTGQVVADGTVGITPIHTTYTLKNDTIRLVPNEIIFNHNIIFDRHQHTGILNGAVKHDHLSDIQCDLHVKANHLLAYDTHDFGEEAFYGTAYLTGDCNIKTKSGELTIDVDATPQKGSQFVYNVAGYGHLDTQKFIKWTSQADSMKNGTMNQLEPLQQTTQFLREIPSDIRLNFLINCTPNMEIKLIMDNQTGDYISLRGNGVLRTNYYNKGTFDIYGNYVVDHGIYRLTVQNIIKKDFQFRQGGTIAFGGNPYLATLDLNAIYTVNGVSLADLNIGKSFTKNNTRVNCLMNITGTPDTPQIDFNLDLPTINNDAKQMVYSLMNSEEEMKQQVLYLLAVGRFYSQETKNAAINNPTQPSQATLAMQSILSGTLSQQINTVLNSVINNTNWNFGANISPGTEGFNNAEYEGSLSGRLLDNRLNINGQFGYRDNPNATTTFIGDFDIKYLLYPNGNLAVKIYNQTNDRYFTRNSLTTQGVGLIIKKDFTNLRDLFGRRRQKKVKTKSSDAAPQPKTK